MQVTTRLRAVLDHFVEMCHPTPSPDPALSALASAAYGPGKPVPWCECDNRGRCPYCLHLIAITATREAQLPAGSPGLVALAAIERRVRDQVAADIRADLRNQRAAWRRCLDPALSILTGRAWWTSAAERAARIATGDVVVTPRKAG